MRSFRLCHCLGVNCGGWSETGSVEDGSGVQSSATNLVSGVKSVMETGISASGSASAWHACRLHIAANQENYGT